MVWRLLASLYIILQVATSAVISEDNEFVTNLRRKAVEIGSNERDIGVIGGRYYYFGTVLQVDIHTAQKLCEDFAMNMANEFWWTSGIRHNEDWMWSGSGLVVQYFDWDNNEPDPPAYPAQSCMWLKDSRMGDYPCDFSNYFICEERSRC
ncbi:UNVERIFIED_CONTAM: hypothetical protein B566_EDAN018671 [Ephemera danica]|nr:hypothetical protein B566_EDAN018671 [Ephemera danica]